MVQHSARHYLSRPAPRRGSGHTLRTQPLVVLVRSVDVLKDVLVPQSLADHHAQLKEAGFTSTDVFFQWYNFAGILASTGQ